MGLQGSMKFFQKNRFCHRRCSSHRAYRTGGCLYRRRPDAIRKNPGRRRQPYFARRRFQVLNEQFFRWASPHKGFRPKRAAVMSRSETAQNAAHRKKGHLGLKTLAYGDLKQVLPGADILNRHLDQIFRFQGKTAGYWQVTFGHVGG